MGQRLLLGAGDLSFVLNDNILTLQSSNSLLKDLSFCRGCL